MAWKTFQLPKIPNPITSAVDALKTIASTASTALTLVKGVVQTLSAVSNTSLDTSQIAIQTAVSVIDAAVKSLTEDSGVYVLLVPPRSKVIIPEAVKAVLSSTQFAVPTTEGLNVQAMFGEEATTAQEAAILRGLFTATGGNAGFVRTVLESFDDLYDDNRPILASTDAVAGMYIVAGSSDIASLIPFTNGMSSLLTPGKPSALDSPAIPSPQNLRAKVVAGGAVRLQWGGQQPLFEIPTLGTYAKITEVAVIRSTSVTLFSASTPQGLFGSSNLSVGTKTGDEQTEVIALLPYQGTITYLDETEHVPGRCYYYAVSFHIKLGTSQELANDGGTDLGFPRLSNVSKVYFSREDHGTPRSIAGVPPDWFRTPRTVDLFPAIGGLLNQLSSFTSQFGDTTTGYGDLLKANVKVIEQQIQSYTDLATQLTAASSAISAFSSINLGAVSIRSFSGTGGTDYIKKDLVKAFGDTSDANRPPFDGDEFVTGVIVLATTPDAVTLLEMLLGTVSAGVSVIANALEQIDVELAAIEAVVFNEDMTVHTGTAVTSVSSTLPLIGDNPSYCYHSYEPNVEFDDTLNPRSS